MYIYFHNRKREREKKVVKNATAFQFIVTPSICIYFVSCDHNAGEQRVKHPVRATAIFECSHSEESQVASDDRRQ